MGKRYVIGAGEGYFLKLARDSYGAEIMEGTFRREYRTSKGTKHTMLSRDSRNIFQR